ncbi:Adenylate kinase A [Acorus gramineus]|uniref:Adenylate kinase A n=1 Tax=Acorus gramineus TaxID=55184 RepID=A0AAV9APB0_ACOGR|nr:Adenylate kinase A [Acorus gramineus]
MTTFVGLEGSKLTLRYGENRLCNPFGQQEDWLGRETTYNDEGHENVRVIDYYSKKGMVATLPAEKPPKEVTVEVQKVLSEK